MTEDQDDIFDPPTSPMPLNYRVPADDRAQRQGPPGCAVAAAGGMIGIFAVLMVLFMLGLQVELKIALLVVQVIGAFAGLWWKRTRAFAVGMLAGYGILLLLFGACVALFPIHI